jgi:hypothetical protein
MGRPSLYRTKIKATYTKADPGSGCKVMNMAGKNRIRNDWNWVFNFFKLNCLALTSLAMANAVAAFTNSEGCKLNAPILYQDVAPFTFFPKTKSPTSDISATIYMIEEKFS